MSQYGAQSAASDHGRTYRQILRFYYPGLELGAARGADPGADLRRHRPTTSSSAHRRGLTVRQVGDGRRRGSSATRASAKRWRLTAADGGSATRVSVFTDRWRSVRIDRRRGRVRRRPPRARAGHPGRDRPATRARCARRVGRGRPRHRQRRVARELPARRRTPRGAGPVGPARPCGRRRSRRGPTPTTTATHPQRRPLRPLRHHLLPGVRRRRATATRPATPRSGRPRARCCSAAASRRSPSSPPATAAGPSPASVPYQVAKQDTWDPVNRWQLPAPGDDDRERLPGDRRLPAAAGARPRRPRRLERPGPADPGHRQQRVGHEDRRRVPDRPRPAVDLVPPGLTGVRLRVVGSRGSVTRTGEISGSRSRCDPPGGARADPSHRLGGLRMIGTGARTRRWGGMRRTLALALLSPAVALVPVALATPALAQQTCQGQTVTITVAEPRRRRRRRRAPCCRTSSPSGRATTRSTAIRVTTSCAATTGNDRLFGGVGSDALDRRRAARTGSGGDVDDDQVRGGAGIDILRGGDDDDLLRGAWRRRPGWSRAPATTRPTGGTRQGHRQLPGREHRGHRRQWAHRRASNGAGHDEVGHFERFVGSRQADVIDGSDESDDLPAAAVTTGSTASATTTCSGSRPARRTAAPATTSSSSTAPAARSARSATTAS